MVGTRQRVQSRKSEDSDAFVGLHFSDIVFLKTIR